MLFPLCDHFTMFKNKRGKFMKTLLDEEVKIDDLYHSFSPAIVEKLDEMF